MTTGKRQRRRRSSYVGGNARPDLEGQFAYLWKLYGEADAQAQVRFHPQRDWRFDFAWINRLVALEIHGGSFMAGRHSRGAGMRSDFEKNNAAIVLGWRVLYATTDMIRNDPLGLCQQINTILALPVLSHAAERAMWLARIRSLSKDGEGVSANGIHVLRRRLRQYVISTSKGDFTIKGECDAVLNLILGK